MTAAVAGLTALFSGAPLRLEQGARKGPTPATIEAMAANWSGEIDFGALYSALAPSASPEQAALSSAFDPADDYWGLPRTPGFETVAAWCGACHSLALVMQQNQPAEGWDRLLSWMVEVQGMPAPKADERAELVSYLAREFGPPSENAATLLP